MAARRRLRLALAAILAAAAAAACGVSDTPGATFDPAAPCTADAQQPGAYPGLEALLPASLEGQDPTSVASGRTCTTDALGTLAAHGVAELRFAGATWEVGGSSGYTVAVFEAPGLDARQVVEFYEAGAKALRPADTFAVTDETVGGRPSVRLDVTGADGSSQVVVAWEDATGADGAVVRALLVANLGSNRTGRLIEELGGG